MSALTTIKERARDFWDRISPRERRLVVIAAIAAPITIAIWLGLAIHDGLAKIDARNEHMRKAIHHVEDLHAKGTPAPVPGGDQDIIDKMGTEPLKLPTYLDDAAKKVGFVLKGTQPHTAQPRNGFVTNSVSCSLDKLTIDQLANFLKEIESSKVVAVTHLDIRRDFRDKDKLNATLEVSTYSKEAPKADAAAGSAAAAGSGKGS